MAIPKKITPDHLKETIVEVRFDSGAPLELMSGIALTLLSPLGYSYIPAPNSNIAVGLGVGQNQQFSIEQQRAGVFNKNFVRVYFSNNIISFNTIQDHYIGWDSYFNAIKEVINIFVTNNFIKSFNRVSIRYISEFDSIDAFKEIDGTISLSKETGFTLDNSIIRLTKEIDTSKVFLTITNKTKKTIDNKSIETSLFDVNIFDSLPPNSNVDILFDSLHKSHKYQKEAFFSIISDDFIKTLNPEY